MTQAALAFAYPGDLQTPSGGYAYDRRVIDGLRRDGWQVCDISLGEGFPLPEAATRAQALATLAKLPREMPIVVDGLALGAMAREARALAATHRVIALVHHPLALEEGLRQDARAALAASERVALEAVAGVIVTSKATSAKLERDFAVSRERILCVEPGTERAQFAAGGGGFLVRLLCVGSLIPRKGHDMLLATLTRLGDLPWTLDIVGSRQLDPACAGHIAALAETPPIDGRVRLHGALDEAALTDFYLAADIFVLASRYEGYGMAFAEAIAHGLPIVATGAGAVADTVPREAGIVVAPDDATGFQAAMSRMICDGALRRQYATGARTAAANLSDWDAAARAFADAIRRFTGKTS